MYDFLKNVKLINTFMRLLNAMNVMKVILTVVIIAVSVMTGAGYIAAVRKIE